MKNRLQKAIACASILITATALRAGTEYSSKAPIAPPPPPPVDSGPYLEITGGALWLQGVGDVDFETGWGINGEIGWRFPFGFSVGLNSGYYNADIESFKIHDVRIDGDLDLVPVMANATYRVTLVDRLSFYVGGGAGVMYSNLDVSASGHGAKFEGSEDGWDFAIQGRAGLAYDICPHGSITVGYRYIRDFIGGDDISGHVLEGGFLFKF
jgi:opacity protein-like surface antigen